MPRTLRVSARLDRRALSLLETAARRSTLRTIELRGCMLGRDGVLALASGCGGAASRLERLSLTACYLGPAAAITVGEILEHATALHELDLSANHRQRPHSARHSSDPQLAPAKNQPAQAPCHDRAKLRIRTAMGLDLKASAHHSIARQTPRIHPIPARPRPFPDRPRHGFITNLEVLKLR